MTDDTGVVTAYKMPTCRGGYRESAVSIYDLDKISLLAAPTVSYRSYYSNVPDAKC